MSLYLGAPIMHFVYNGLTYALYLCLKAKITITRKDDKICKSDFLIMQENLEAERLNMEEHKSS